MLELFFSSIVRRTHRASRWAPRMAALVFLVVPIAGAFIASCGDDAAVAVCAYNSDCTAPLVCRDGACVTACFTDVDCPPGSVCVNEVCVLPTEPPPEEPCNLNSDCPFPMRCGNGGKCVHECNENIDCPLVGTCCLNHECTTGPACFNLSDAGWDGPAPGAPCSSNYQCDDHIFCNGPERCSNGQCAPALDTPCNSHSSCILDLCAEGAANPCTHQVKAGADVDGDGHLSLGCEGGDDCFDEDPTVYATAPELCDGKDNDCDDLIDDFTTVPFRPTYSLPFTFEATGGISYAHLVPIGTSKFLGIGPTPKSPQPLELTAMIVNQNGVVEMPPKVILPWGTIYAALPSGGDVLVIGQNPVTFEVDIAVVKSDLTTTPVVHVATYNALGASGAWTGSKWILAFVKGQGNRGAYTIVNPDGTLEGPVFPVPTDANGSINQRHIFGLVSGAGDVAVAYTKVDNTFEMVQVNPTTGNPQAIVPLPFLNGPPSAYSLVGTPTGYGAIWVAAQTLHVATFEVPAGQIVNFKQVDVAATIGASVADLSLIPYKGGLAFNVMSDPVNLIPTYGYWRGGLEDPVEIVPLDVITNSYITGIAPGEKLAPYVVHNSGKTLSWRNAGCQN